MFNNPHFLKIIRPSAHVLCAVTNRGHQDSHMIGDFQNLGPLWYNPETVANIPALKGVHKI